MNSKHKLPLTLLALSTTAAIPAVAHASVPPNFDVSSGSVVTVGGVATSGMVEANSPDALRVPIMSTPLVRYQGAGTQGCDSYARVTHTYSSGTYTGEYESEALCQYVALESDDIVPALWESMGLSQLVWPAGR